MGLRNEPLRPDLWMLTTGKGVRVEVESVVSVMGGGGEMLMYC